MRDPRRFLRSEAGFAWALNVPSLVAIVAIMLYPLGYSFVISLFRYRLTSADRPFIGLDNYLRLLADPTFWTSLWLTIVIVVGTVIGSLVIGLLLAIQLNQPMRGRPILRALLLVPWAMPPVITGIMWNLAYHPSFGVLNAVLTRLGIIETYQAWLTSPTSAVIALLIAQIWHLLPLAALPLLAGLQAIGPEYYEAAAVDGASLRQRFRYITLPFLAGPVLLVLVLVTSSSFKIFDMVYTLTFGGPGDATSVLAWKAYRTSFSNGDLGYGSSWAYAIALLIAGFTLVYVRVLQHRQIDA